MGCITFDACIGNLSLADSKLAYRFDCESFQENAVGDTSGNGAGILLLDPYAASYFPQFSDFDRRYEGVLEPSSLYLVDEMAIPPSILDTSGEVHIAVSPHLGLILLADQQQILCYKRDIFSGKLQYHAEQSVNGLQGLVTLPNGDPNGFLQITLSDGQVQASNLFGANTGSYFLTEAPNATGLCVISYRYGEAIFVVDGVNNTVYIYNNTNGTAGFVRSITYDPELTGGELCFRYDTYSAAGTTKHLLIGGNEGVLRIDLDALQDQLWELDSPMTHMVLSPAGEQLLSLRNGKLYSLSVGAIGSANHTALISRALRAGVYIFENSLYANEVRDLSGTIRAINGIDGVTALSGTYRGHVGVRSGYNYEDLYILVNNTLLHFDVADDMSPKDVITGQNFDSGP
jgi:hypothetical protein